MNRITLVIIVLAAGCGGTITGTGDAGTDTGTADARDTAWDTAGDTARDTAVDTAPDTPTTPCGGAVPDPCPEGWFCELPAGHCDPALINGVCVEIPTEGCPEYYSPECGCDGVTYENSCFRIQAEQHLQLADRCPPPDPCLPGAGDCRPREICEIPPDSCWLEGVTGVCMRIRDDCGSLYDPVCACDGTTYRNDCDRMAALVARDHWGDCGPECGMPGDPPCAEGSFCELPTGFCTPSGIPGECMSIPTDCPDLWAPVCGCDDTTYPNDCDRRAAEVQLSHYGEC